MLEKSNKEVQVQDNQQVYHSRTVIGPLERSTLVKNPESMFLSFLCLGSFTTIFAGTYMDMSLVIILGFILVLISSTIFVFSQ